MKKKILTLSIALLTLTNCQNKQKETVLEQTKNLIEPEISVARGNYLVNTMGCDDCHSPKKMGPQGPEIIQELRFSGYPSERQLQHINKSNLVKGWVLFNSDLTSAVGHWEQSFVANFISDGSGIGNWSIDNFMLVMRNGKYKGQESSRNLLRSMPCTCYKNLCDADLKCIFHFLLAIKPVNNVVPSPISPNDLRA